LAIYCHQNLQVIILTLEYKINITHIITRISFFLLLATLALNLWFKEAPFAVYVVALTPLLVFIPGILNGNIRTLIWVCFVLLMYFAIATYKVSGPQPENLDIMETILIVLLFIAATINSRLRQKNNIALY
jgi:uncharacterized membrane protein